MSTASVHTEIVPGLVLVDTGYLRPRLAASYLLESGGRAAFVETGATPNVPRLLEVLSERGVAREAVDYVFVTHVHLDHAGAAGALMAELPEARLVVHPRGARHMIDPSKLVAGAIAVYGEETFARSYETVVPVPAERVVEATDGLALEVGGRRLEILDSPGHAYHHYVLHDPASRGVFTGDTFGLSYREFDTDQGAFVFPTTTPVHFDPEAMHASIDRILALRPERLYLTHFGVLNDPEAAGRALHETIDAFVGLARQLREAPDRHTTLVRALRGALLERLRAHGCSLPDEAVDAIVGMDVELDAQGLEVWLDRAA